MRKFILLLAVLLGLGLLTWAQPGTGKITGTVTDGNAKTIESSTITLLWAIDSSVVKMSAADKNGRFEFENVGAGRFIVSVFAIGHQKGYSPVFELSSSKPSIILQPIDLVPAAKNMGEVTVVAKKPLIEQKIDRT